MKSKKQLRQEQERIEKIKQEHNIKEMFELEDNGWFALILMHFLWKEYEAAGDNLSAMSHAKSTAWLSILLWEIVESDGVESFFDASDSNHFARYTDEMTAALKEIGAITWAELFQRAASLFPTSERYGQVGENAQWNNLDWKELDDINSQMYEYPDGNISDLVRAYAENNRTDFETWKNDETIQAIENVRNRQNLSRGFSNVQELIENLNADD